MQRRSFLSYLAGLTGAVVFDPVGNPNLDLVGHLQAVTDLARDHQEVVPPRALYALLRRHADVVDRAAKLARMPTYRAELLRVLAETEGHAGHLAAYDLADHRAAGQHLDRALRAARLADEPTLEKWVIVQQAESINLADQHDDGLLLLESTGGTAQAPRARGYLLAHRAVTLAFLAARGDQRRREHTRRALAALNHARPLLAGADEDDAPFIGQFGMRRWYAFAGLAMLQLDEPGEAERHVRAALDLGPPRADEASLRLDLATTYAVRGEPSQACVEAAAAVATLRDLGVPATRTKRLRTLRRVGLAPYARTQVVREFDELLRDVGIAV